MEKFPSGIKFCYPWRSYQAKVLEDLGVHLQDKNLNIVAAPGSGKTILGLEVMLRIGKPTLILAPSNAIKNQWIQRFQDHFLQQKNLPDWISDTIKSPRFLTVSTYQGLHAAFSDVEDPEDEEELTDEESESVAIKKTQAQKLLKQIEKLGIQTIIVDEAHHMRNAWWESLEYLNSHLQGVHIVSLTATPPYDVSAHEWSRYESLCGNIDAEISVPELVAKKNLCPHQDYIYFSSLTQEEQNVVDTFRKQATDFVYRLQYDSKFINILQSHRYIQNTDNFLSEILWNVEYYSSILIFLKSSGYEGDRDLFRIVGSDKSDAPSFDSSWAEILFENLLYKDRGLEVADQEYLQVLKGRLKKIEAIEKNIVSLHGTKQIEKLLKQSINKLDAITHISRKEYKNMGSDLRMVILTDYIRKEALPNRENEKISFSKIGVVPIFEKLRKELSPDLKLGILSGSFVVIPQKALKNLYTEAHKLGIENKNIVDKTLKHDSNYCSIQLKGSADKKIVQLITQLFHIGDIEIMVGTKSLLGEGWDAPSINTLILASFVGSFVLSNQMRGRSIRIDPNVADKVSNIWHIATVENSLDPGVDVTMLSRRFKAFVGVSFIADTIENGFERMGIHRSYLFDMKISAINKNTFESSKDRSALAAKWRHILKNGEIKEIVPELSIAKGTLPRDVIFSNTIFSVLLWGSPFFIYKVLEYFLFPASTSYPAIIITALSFLFLSPGLSKAGYLFLKNGPISGEMKQIGQCVIESLGYLGYIQDHNKINIYTRKDGGRIHCFLEGATVYEKSLFLDCMQEILDPIDNPRYLILRSSFFGFIQRKDYHAVPKIIGKNKKGALYFHKIWRKKVGSSKLIYTKNIKGRQKLLHARQNALSTSFLKSSERKSVWR